MRELEPLVKVCKTCKRWDRHDTECNAVEWEMENKNQSGDNFAIFATASDDQGLIAKLKTGPLFGCVYWEARKWR